jgi:hypothetical protein
MKPRRLHEGAEVIDVADGIAVLGLDPAMEFLDRGAARRAHQSLDHRPSPVAGSGREIKRPPEGKP